MITLVFRLILSLGVLAAGICLFVIVGSPRRAVRDPALRYLKIPLLPELLYTSIEVTFLALSLAGISPPFFLSPLSDCVQYLFGLAYVFFMYRLWDANGLSHAGHIPIAWFVGATAVNYFIFAARYPFPALESAIQVANKVIVGCILLYAGACAVTARGKKSDFYPSTCGGFWMAFFCLAYAPFVGLADMFSLTVSSFDPGRPVSLQLFPARELVVLVIFAVHMEPLYSRLWGRPADPADSLSARECEVAALLRRGKTNGEIAGELNVSLATVKTHVRNVLRKSSVGSRVDLIERTREIGS